METVYIGIGSNLGDRLANLGEAIRRMGDVKRIKVVGVSGFYETEPEGGPTQPRYMNGVARIETDIEPEELLVELKNIERAMGRKPVPERNLPREIDLDVLLYGRRVVDTAGLKIPHPKMHERAFVLKGLCEISPEVRHPVTGMTAEEIFEVLDKSGLCPKRDRSQA